MNALESIRLIGVASLFQPSLISAGTFDRGSELRLANCDGAHVAGPDRENSSCCRRRDTGSLPQRYPVRAGLQREGIQR